MNDLTFRVYRQDLLLAILRRHGEAMTAGEAAEATAIVGPGEGHPEECWRGITPAVAAGHFRALEQRALVMKGAVGRKNPRSGRDDPTWEPAQGYDARAPFPEPPEDEASAPAPEPLSPSSLGSVLGIAATAQRQYGELNRAQVYTLLGVQDAMIACTARFMREIAQVSQDARRQLAAVGLETSDGG